MKYLYLVLIFVLFATSSNGQFSIEEPNKQEHPTLISIQKSFDVWSSTKDLSKEKGWKHYKRWDEYYSQRLNSNGNMPSTNLLLQEAKKYNALKKTKAAENELWLPVGPDKFENEPFYQKGIGRINCVAFHPTNKDTFWVGVAQGGIWKTTNGGVSWLPLNNNLPILRISDIAVDPINPDIIYVCLGDIAYLGYSLYNADKVRQTHFGIGVYKTTNGGSNWEPTGLSIDQEKLDYSLLKKLIINPDNTNHLIAGGIEGIWTSLDAGDTWDKKLDTMICDLEIDPTNSNTLYAATSFIKTLNDGRAGVYKSSNFGDSWTLLNTGIPEKECQRIELAIAPSNNNYIYAIANDLNGGYHGLYLSKDAGETWELKNGNTAINIFAWYNGVDEFGGQSTYDMVLLVDPNDENTVYAGGVNLWGSSNGGTTWKGVSYWRSDFGPSLHADQHNFKYNSTDNKFYMCNDGGIYRTDTVVLGDWDSTEPYTWPTEWEYISDGMQITSFYRIGISQNNEDCIIGGAQDNSTYYYDGSSWNNLFGGDGMECIIHNNDPNHIWASSQYGYVGYSIDGGQSFIATEYIQEVGSWTTPFNYNYKNNQFYLAKGNLYQSGNNGENYQSKSNFNNVTELGSPAPASSFSQSLNNPEVFYLAKRIYHAYNVPSKLWLTKNNGLFWEDITGNLPSGLYFSQVIVDDDDPDLAWIVMGGYESGKKVYKTTDGGTNWVNISYNLPNIPVNTIVLDNNTKSHVIYIGTDLGVYYLSDLTNEWQLWGSNLPNVIVSELEINYKNEQLYAATFGRGIWQINKYIDPNGNQVGINETSSKVHFDCALFPNINDGNFKIAINTAIELELKVDVINIMGSVMHSEIIIVNTGKNTIPLNLALNYGQYYVKISHATNSKVVPIIVQ